MKFVALSLVLLGLLTFAPTPSSAADPPKAHHIAIQIDVADPAVLNMSLNNIRAIYSAYKDRHEPVDVELVAFGPGLAMLRDDISPVKQRLAEAHQSYPTLVFSACENSRQAAMKAEGKDIAIVPEARLVPAGVVRLSELQEQGFTYIRP